MAKNSVTSFGLGDRIPTRETHAEPDKKADKTAATTSRLPEAMKTTEDRDTIKPNSIIEIDAEEEEVFPKRETRSQRVNLLVEPTNYKKLRKYLKKRDQSFNDFVCTYIADFIKAKEL